MLGLLKKFSFAIMIISLTSLAHAKAPKVVVTIKPVYSLVKEIMSGAAAPKLLLDGNADPHHFSLTPSQAKSIKESDLIIWIGPILEDFLVRPIANDRKKRLTLMSTKGLTLVHRSSSKGCLIEAACKEDHKHHSHDHAHSHKKGTHPHSHKAHDHKKSVQKKEISLERKGQLDEYVVIDPHIWLDVGNAILMVKEIAYHLSAVDLENAALYQQNAEALIEKLKALQKELDNKARTLRHFHFLAFHDAYAYLEYRYNLTNSAAEAISGGHEPTLKSHAAIRNIIKRRGVKCIFSEPHHPSKLEESLEAEFKLERHIIDPLGTQIEAGPDHYFLLMRSIMSSLARCQEKHHGSKK